jgi:hypothetical protein
MGVSQENQSRGRFAIFLTAQFPARLRERRLRMQEYSIDSVRGRIGPLKNLFDMAWFPSVGSNEPPEHGLKYMERAARPATH